MLMRFYNSLIASYAAFREPYKSIIGFYHFVIAFYTAFIATDKQGVRGRKDIYMEYYIPTKEADFVEWSGNLIAVSKANSGLWDLPEDHITELETLHIQCKGLYEKCQTSSHTALDIQAKKELKTELIDKERHFVRFHLQNNEKMNARDGRRCVSRFMTRLRPIIHRLILTRSLPAAARTLMNLSCTCRILKAGRGRSLNMGMERFWSMGEAPITNPEDLKASLLVTHTSYHAFCPLGLEENPVYS
jgi:hypothetical protein